MNDEWTNAANPSHPRPGCPFPLDNPALSNYFSGNAPPGVMSNYLNWGFWSETDRLLFRAKNGGFRAENEAHSGSIKVRNPLIYQHFFNTTIIKKTTNRQNALYQLVVVMVAPQARLELATTRLTAECSAIELLRNNEIAKNIFYFSQSFGDRRRPTLPGRFQPSTIGAEGLNFCVRDGYR